MVAGSVVAAPLQLWVYWLSMLHVCRMVKFVLKKVVDGCRSGELIVNDTKLETPMCMLYTRAGNDKDMFCHGQ